MERVVAKRHLSDDRSAEVTDLLVARWRAMSPAERFDQVAGLNESCLAMAEAGVRARHPEASANEVRLRMYALRLGRDLAVEVYGWDPDVEGW